MKTIEREDFLNYRFFSSLSLSPSGSKAVFCLTQAVKETNSYSAALFMRDENGVASVPGGENIRAFCWLDETHLLCPAAGNESDRAFVAAGGELTVFYSLDIVSGERKELFRVPKKGAAAKKVSDTLFALSFVRDNARPDIEAMPEEKRSAALLEWKQEADFEVVDELPFFSDGRGFINKKRHALALFDLASGTLTDVTEKNFETSNFALSPDGRYIAYSGVNYDRYFVRPCGIYLYDIAEGTTKTLLAPGSYQIMGMDFMGDELVLAAYPWNGEGPFPNHDIYTLPLSGGKLHLRHRHTTEDFGNKSCSDSRYGAGTTFKVHNGALYYFTTCDTAAYLNRWEKGSAPVRLTDERIIPDSFAVSGDKVLVTGTTDALQELFSVNADKSLSQLSDINTAALEGRYIGKPKKYQFVDADGFVISGFVIEPVGYDPAKTYPGILEIHGGPRAAFTDGFFHEMQLLAGKGYFVFFCNPRGSAGGGEDFANIRAKRGTVDFADVMAWTDFVLEHYPAIDKKRLAVMGGSYGGYLTNWCITHTDRFAAAVSMRSISNITGDYGATDYGVWGTPGVYGGTPWNNPELLTEQSPYTYAMNVKTPTLFLHSFEDYRCTMSGAMQMYAALQIKGVPTRMCLFKNSCHELSRSGAPRSRIRRLKELCDWVDSYLMAE